MITKKDCKPHFDLQVKEREVQEAIVRAMVKQNSMTVGMPTTRMVAKQLGMKAPELYKLLRQEGVLTKNEYGYWFCDGYNDIGLARMRFFIYFDGDGDQCLKQYPVWTKRGVDFIKEMIYEQRGS
jgi:phage antirepressor YoqD-like protein